MRSHLTVLPGGRDDRVPRHPNFIRCEATDTRLMGVVGVKAIEETDLGIPVVHFFHLDFEEFGIDAYERLENPLSDEIELVTARLMGGLGGVLQELDVAEMTWLIRQAYNINIRQQEEFPEGIEGLFHFICGETAMDSQGIRDLWKKITPELMTDPELIHYFMMRVGAQDLAAVDFLGRGTGQPIFEQSHGMLVRNRVQSLRESGGIRYWQSEALLDTDREYWMLAGEIGVFEENGERRVFSASVQSQFRVSEFEASFILRRPEYLAIYEILDPERLQIFLDLYRPGALVNHQEAGMLYTWFKSDNSHVREVEYFINNDVQHFYYMTDEDQLVVCALSPQLLDDAQQELNSVDLRSFVHFERLYRSETPILYDFVQSDYLDFHEFWEDAQE